MPMPMWLTYKQSLARTLYNLAENIKLKLYPMAITNTTHTGAHGQTHERTEELTAWTDTRSYGGNKH